MMPNYTRKKQGQLLVYKVSDSFNFANIWLINACRHQGQVYHFIFNSIYPPNLFSNSCFEINPVRNKAIE